MRGGEGNSCAVEGKEGRKGGCSSSEGMEWGGRDKIWSSVIFFAHGTKIYVIDVAAQQSCLNDEFQSLDF